MKNEQGLSQVFRFLYNLKANNNREWFGKNKKIYQESLENMVSFANELISEMNQFDNIETKSGKLSLFRIYRDTRFSNDKTPYKTHWAGHLRRATKQLRGGYYYHLQPGGSFIAGGFFGPNGPDLKHIRSHIAQDDDELRSVLNSHEIYDYFGSLQGEKLITAPRGYKEDHPAIDLLRYKQFILKHNFTDQEVLSDDFLFKLVEGFRKMRTFFDYMSEILTTDLNGVPLETK
jgi:uncharacterized protein (TIGR02453 family)